MRSSPRRFILSALFLTLAGSISPVNAKFDPTKEFQEPPAVAKHFTAPENVQFDTPAFKKGKIDFTSQQEMEGFIERLALSSPAYSIAWVFAAGQSHSDAGFLI